MPSRREFEELVRTMCLRRGKDVRGYVDRYCKAVACTHAPEARRRQIDVVVGLMAGGTKSDLGRCSVVFATPGAASGVFGSVAALEHLSLLVMDEVLTHLDASGREAVGALLRRIAMPAGALSTATSESVADDGDEYDNGDEVASLPSLADGTHATVLVILQDLAATELEESFDSIDVVRKRGPFATVEVDGE